MWDRVLVRVLMLLPMGCVLALSQGCMHFNKNGKASDDGEAIVAGILGCLTFWVGLESKKFGLIALGVILVLA